MDFVDNQNVYKELISKVYEEIKIVNYLYLLNKLLKIIAENRKY